ncbi:MAG: hypothetical protein ACOYJ2_07795 [Rickettsiales bacterium]
MSDDDKKDSGLGGTVVAGGVAAGAGYVAANNLANSFARDALGFKEAREAAGKVGDKQLLTAAPDAPTAAPDAPTAAPDAPTAAPDAPTAVKAKEPSKGTKEFIEAVGGDNPHVTTGKDAAHISGLKKEAIHKIHVEEAAEGVGKKFKISVFDNNGQSKIIATDVLPNGLESGKTVSGANITDDVVKGLGKTAKTAEQGALKTIREATKAMPKMGMTRWAGVAAITLGTGLAAKALADGMFGQKKESHTERLERREAEAAAALATAEPSR